MTVRSLTVDAANWCVVNKGLFDYLEQRPFELFKPTPQHRIANDCSATAILCLWLAGAPEPFQGAYQGEGNTESFLTLEHVTTPLAGDFVVYGEGLSLSVQHMATIVQAGPDPLTMSHGGSAEPAWVHVSQGCPPAAQGRVTYIRCLPVDPPPPPPLEDNMLLIVTNPNNGGQAILNLAEGTFYGFDSPDMLGFYKDNGVKVATREPTKAEWSHFTQRGTI